MIGGSAARTDRFGPAKLIVASNRGPLTVTPAEDGSDHFERGAGGLVSGIERALSHTPSALWICAAMSERERSVARRAAGHGLADSGIAAAALAGEFDVVLLPIEAHTFRQAYNAISNSTLWFVLHMLFEPAREPLFDAQWRRQWAGYQRYTAVFTDAIADRAAFGATVMVQDYHLFLLPGALRAIRPDLRIGHFTHTPWVPPDYFRLLPDDVAIAIVEGMLGADVLGFHTQRWLAHFESCCQAVLGCAPKARLAVFGLTTDGEQLLERGHRRDVRAPLRDLAESVGDCQVIGRVDRTELSKNVLRGLLAYRELLRRWPQWLGCVVHAVFDYPSREDLPHYREYTAAIERLSEEINDEFSTDTWQPLILSIEQDYPAALAALRRTDVLFINSLRDGMNLVAFEGVVLADADPVLVLSREAGAATLVGDAAILINPFDISQSAQALHDALSMAPEERAARAQRLRRAATSMPPVPWFQAQLDAVNAASRGGE